MHTILLTIFSLLTFAFATSSSSSQPTVYDSTVYVTSTIYHVNTVTATGTPPAIPAANSTSTISATHPPAMAPSYAVPGNATTVKPTSAVVVPSASGAGSGVAPSGVVPSGVAPTPSQFAGAAARVGPMDAALFAVGAAGVVFFAL